mmetsp:Transcript_26848/g.86963  ORF Transcript_26848/g.86963 Transcript_26848/m.86963 type:complete len:338 (-) Transcript_26848:165-1178(-)
MIRQDVLHLTAWKCLNHRIAVRAFPDIDGPRLDVSLEPGQEFTVRKEERCSDDVLYLKLLHVDGWVFEYKPGVGTMCKQISMFPFMAPPAARSRFPEDSAAHRHCLPRCEAQSLSRSSMRMYFDKLEDLEEDPGAMLDLQERGFLPRRWVPSAPFHRFFPAGSQVTRFESTTAYTYTAGSHFAYEMNEFMRNEDWDQLFDSCGRIVKCLQSYSEKMQDLYGKEQTLYRGFSAPEDEIQEEYKEGSRPIWKSFSSTTDVQDIALDFACGSADSTGNTPVLCIISTLSRGAPLLGWSKYPHEREILLLPFQGFEVVKLQASTRMGRRVMNVHLQTIKCF